MCAGRAPRAIKRPPKGGLFIAISRAAYPCRFPGETPHNFSDTGFPRITPVLATETMRWQVGCNMNTARTTYPFSGYTIFEIIRAITAKRNATRRSEQVLFFVRARFVGAATRLIAANSHEMYFREGLGWQPLEKATRFETRETAESVASKMRSIIRNTGNRTASVSVIAYSLGYERTGGMWERHPAANSTPRSHHLHRQMREKRRPISRVGSADGFLAFRR